MQGPSAAEEEPKCPESLAFHLFRPALTCFSDPEPWNFNGLVLISFALARARAADKPPPGTIRCWRSRRGAAYRREAPAASARRPSDNFRPGFMATLTDEIA